MAITYIWRLIYGNWKKSGWTDGFHFYSNSLGKQKFPFWKKKIFRDGFAKYLFHWSLPDVLRLNFFLICLVKFPGVEESLRWLTWSLLFSLYISTENPEINCSTCDYLCIQRKILKSYLHQRSPSEYVSITCTKYLLLREESARL